MDRQSDTEQEVSQTLPTKPPVIVSGMMENEYEVGLLFVDFKVPSENFSISLSLRNLPFPVGVRDLLRVDFYENSHLYK